ncbi:MAG: leucyl/phenylalanyl-tRNA--protein transferase, partial [Candidatus Hydrogenedentota bacterium]
PDPRLVLFPEEFHRSRSLRKTIRRRNFEIRFDTVFEDVITGCAEAPRSYGEGTWITEEMKRAYTRLHELGYAHSIECWHEGTLAGGVYGLSLGSCFFGESMFTRVTDASKVALSVLAQLCEAWGFEFIDCQLTNEHLLTLGAREIPREDFLNRLHRNLEHRTRRGSWKRAAREAVQG